MNQRDADSVKLLHIENFKIFIYADAHIILISIQLTHFIVKIMNDLIYANN